MDVFLAGIDVYVGLVEQLASKDTLPGEEEQLKRRKVNRWALQTPPVQGQKGPAASG